MPISSDAAEEEEAEQTTHALLPAVMATEPEPESAAEEEQSATIGPISDDRGSPREATEHRDASRAANQSFENFGNSNGQNSQLSLGDGGNGYDIADDMFGDENAGVSGAAAEAGPPVPGQLQPAPAAPRLPIDPAGLLRALVGVGGRIDDFMSSMGLDPAAATARSRPALASAVAGD